jgi:hypothetical protein
MSGIEKFPSKSQAKILCNPKEQKRQELFEETFKIAQMPKPIVKKIDSSNLEVCKENMLLKW